MREAIIQNNASEETIKKYPGTKNLIPFSKRDKETHRIISRQGGLSKSKAKTEGQNWRFITERMTKEGINKADQEWILERITNREAATTDLIIKLEKLEKDIHPAQRVALMNTFKDLMRFQHGEKVHTENVNVNVNTTLEEWEKRMSEDDEK